MTIRGVESQPPSCFIRRKMPSGHRKIEELVVAATEDGNHGLIGKQLSDCLSYLPDSDPVNRAGDTFRGRDAIR